MTIICCFALAATPLAGAQSKAKCTQEDAIKAETQASSLQDWAGVYKSYKRFAQCDDAAIGEGYSDSVARLLSDGWRQFYQLNSLALHDRNFERFVLRHIDQLMSPDQEKKIRANAVAHCMPPRKRLCRSIVTRLDQTASRP